MAVLEKRKNADAGTCDCFFIDHKRQHNRPKVFVSFIEFQVPFTKDNLLLKKRARSYKKNLGSSKPNTVHVSLPIKDPRAPQTVPRGQ